MQSRFEGSLLTSLAELRAIEEQRLATERAAREAEVAARQAEEAASVASELERVRAARDEQLRIEEARLAAERDARLRVEAIEAAERARRSADLEQQRLEHEIELRRAEVAKKRPTWMLAVTSVALAGGLALGVFAVRRADEASRAGAQAARASAIAGQARRDAAASRARVDELAAELDRLDGRVQAAEHDVEVAQNDADRRRAADHLATVRRERAETQRRIDWEIRTQKKDLTECSKQALGCMDR